MSPSKARANEVERLLRTILFYSGHLQQWRTQKIFMGVFHSVA